VTRLLSAFNPALKEGSLLRQSMIALATAFLLILSFPNFDLNFLVWVALAPLLRVIADGVSLRRAFWLGWLSGVVFTFFAENWIANSMVHFGEMMTVMAYAVSFLFAAVLALFPALFAMVMAQLVRRFGWRAIALAPVIWVATEWLRPIITGVTWNALGVSQAHYLPIARLSRFGGVYLISAEIVAVSALIVLLLKIKDRAVLRAAAVLLMSTGIIFMLPTTQSPTQAVAGPSVDVVGVQPNLSLESSDTPSGFARDLEESIKLTHTAVNRASDRSVDLVVWAESPLPLFYENDLALRNRLDQLAKEIGGYLIISSTAREDQKYFNSVNIIGPDTELNGEHLTRYDKIRLVPFGEYVPWHSVLGRFVPAIVGEFTPGTKAVVNVLKLRTERDAVISGSDIDRTAAIERTTDYLRVGSFICYEAAYPGIVSQFVRNGASLLVNVSNDAWFGTTAGARQHLAHAVMRAIENDRDIVRVTNTGISALITANGRVIDPLPIFTAGSQVWKAQSRRGLTYYARHGDRFAAGCVIVSLLILAFSIIRFRLKTPDPAR
jgi:apolipoprotein N-acyltransferase